MTFQISDLITFFIVKQLYTFFIVILGKNFLNSFFPLSSKKNGLPREWDYVKEHDEYVLVHSLTFDIPGRQSECCQTNTYCWCQPESTQYNTLNIDVIGV